MTVEKHKALRGSYEGTDASVNWYFSSRRSALWFVAGVLVGLLAVCAALVMVVLLLMGVVR